MAKAIEHVHWPDAPDMWMPYAPAIKVNGGTTVYLAGVTAAPVYHHHPHRPEEFDAMPREMAGQARAALENLKRGLEAVGATFSDVVTADRFVTDLSDQDALNRVWGEYFRDARPATTTVQVVRLATDPRCMVEINAVAGIDCNADARPTGGATFDRAARPDRPQVPNGPNGKPDLSHENARDGGGRITLRIFDCHKPVIAAVNGPAVGIGVTMLLPMDVRIASTDARFGFVFSQRGIVPEAASSWFLPRIIGIAQALEWCYSGRVFPAQEALAGRLVSKVVPPDDLLPTARALAKEFAAKTAPVSVALIRQMMWRMMGADDPMEAHKVDSRGIYARGRSDDVKEGVVSFLEKRPAQFKNKVSSDMPDYFPWWTEREYK